MQISELSCLSQTRRFVTGRENIVLPSGRPCHAVAIHIFQDPYVTSCLCRSLSCWTRILRFTVWRMLVILILMLKFWNFSYVCIERSERNECVNLKREVCNRASNYNHNSYFLHMRKNYTMKACGGQWGKTPPTVNLCITCRCGVRLTLPPYTSKWFPGFYMTTTATSSLWHKAGVRDNNFLYHAKAVLAPLDRPIWCEVLNGHGRHGKLLRSLADIFGVSVWWHSEGLSYLCTVLDLLSV